MTPVIHILDAHSANQIAAGEVVERPVSVVKELVENALDAGAKHIDITIEGNGVPLIRVRDDGCGIAISDLPLSVIRHATSKIRGIGDLDDLRTLGFRGEALPSIASVSQIEISSRPADEVAGLCLALNGGEQEEFKEVGCPVGTSVTVRNLFFNTPARLKFLKSTPTEFGLISDTVSRIALAHPDISFSLTHPHQVVLQTSGRGDLRETIGAILGHTIARQLIPLNAQQEDWQIEGFISPPDLVRSSKQAQTFMINGRIVRSPFLSRALEDGYHTLIPAKLHPVVVLHLHVPPSEYDVNVHPTKMDVRFKNEPALTTFISKAVYQTLINSKPLPSFQKRPAPSFQPKSTLPLQSFPPSSTSGLPANPKIPLQIREIAAPSEVKPLDNEPPIKPQTFEQPNFFNPTPGKSRMLESQVFSLAQQRSPNNSNNSNNSNKSYNSNISNSQDQSSLINQPQAEPNLLKDLDQDDLPAQDELQTEDILSHLWPLAQLFNTYILATDGKILLMIDQHAAHERINYERLLAEFKAAERTSQALLIPLPMEFTLQEEQALLEHLWILTEMGFVLEQFGSRTYLLRGVPVQTGTFPADEMLRQFIEEVLQKNSTPSFDKLLEEWIHMLACKESIKAQDSLSLLEMEQLIAQLGKTDNPYTCPHGRPTMVKMTRSELERRFYRT
ncbi:DNA mismatch repair endonuclease MutL [Desulfosporosinus sp. OT]|uniref:DNA mismatch repair endonuclease MutL n=1 Tax=Desulfosporosinus sp. OT TaxID=913865 RepID=UPI0002239B1B|nr:DNA mismatch repair endonuclease MutL [Desulfosporosinus sp. OT]EGW40264.1 DNA mismatch repair MutL family protein [Desulfosporosinus sp. OT]